MASKKLKLYEVIVDRIVLLEKENGGIKMDIVEEDGFIVINYMREPYNSFSHWNKIRVGITL